jgi:amidase
MSVRNAAVRPDRAEVGHGAFVEHGPHPFNLTDAGPLAGLTFAVKDLFDVEGVPTACGNPDRLRECGVADTTAPSVLVALAAGATLEGKTHTDEVACGMFGTNPHFGTPINPKAPDRVPGGSSSGSASAVAAGLCDFALGTDTGGSVRVPASFCGIYGIRTTFGRISTAGVMAMAPSFDTVGWLAADAETFARVGEVYFGPLRGHGRARLMIARDAFDIPRPEIADVLLPVARSLGEADEIVLYEEGIDHWLDTFRPLQLYDLRATLGRWANVSGRVLSQSVSDRIKLSFTVRWQDVAPAIVRRETLTERLVQLLGDDGVVVIPTAHNLPPKREATLADLVDFREKTLALTCVASLTRLPQVSLPVATLEGCPVGLSLIGGPRADERLLSLARNLSAGRVCGAW